MDPTGTVAAGAEKSPHAVEAVRPQGSALLTGPRRERAVIGRALVILALSALNFGAEVSLSSQAKVARSPQQNTFN